MHLISFVTRQKTDKFLNCESAREGAGHGRSGGEGAETVCNRGEFQLGRMRRMLCGAFHLPRVCPLQFSVFSSALFQFFSFAALIFSLFHFTYIFRSEFFSSSSTLGSFFCCCVSHERRKKSGQRQTTAEMTENAKQLSARGSQVEKGKGG